jgi:hypothetical protein
VHTVVPGFAALGAELTPVTSYTDLDSGEHGYLRRPAAAGA